MVVIKIKALVQSEPRVQHRGADHRSRLISGLFEHRSQSRLKRAKFIAAEIMHAAQHGIRAGQHRSVRRQSYGNNSEGALKARSVRSQAIDVGSLDLLISVAANVIGAQRIDCDQYNIDSAALRSLRAE